MYADFSFLEYTYNPTEISEHDIQKRLSNMGFVLYSVHVNNTVSVWTQGICILFVKKDPEAVKSCFTGVGFMSDVDDFDIDVEHDVDTDFYYTTDPEGNKIFFVLPDTMGDTGGILSEKYLKAKTHFDKPKSPLFESVSGILLNTNDSKTLEFYENLGFKATKKREQYQTMVSSNNRFSVICTQNSLPPLFCVVFDTDDIFYATAKLKIEGFHLKQYDNPCEAEKFEDLAHKITGYNCVAFGSSKSYSIENLCQNPLPNTDIIFRMRKQYLHLSQDTLERHYDDRSI